MGYPLTAIERVGINYLNTVRYLRILQSITILKGTGTYLCRSRWPVYGFETFTILTYTLRYLFSVRAEGYLFQTAFLKETIFSLSECPCIRNSNRSELRILSKCAAINEIESIRQVEHLKVGIVIERAVSNALDAVGNVYLLQPTDTGKRTITDCHDRIRDNKLSHVISIGEERLGHCLHAVLDYDLVYLTVCERAFRLFQRCRNNESIQCFIVVKAPVVDLFNVVRQHYFSNSRIASVGAVTEIICIYLCHIFTVYFRRQYDFCLVVLIFAFGIASFERNAAFIIDYVGETIVCIEIFLFFSTDQLGHTSH